MIMIISNSVEAEKRRHIGIILSRNKTFSYQLGLNHKFKYSTAVIISSEKQIS